MMSRLTVLRSTMLLCAALSAAPASAQTPPHFKVTTLSAGMFLIKAEVAATEAEREYGLMHRTTLGTNEGMVFLFRAPASVCMWMKNTPLPLSVAFIDAKGKVVNIEDMQPQTTNSHCAARPIVYALEMNLGWFKQKNIKPGATIGGLDHLQ